MSDEKGYYVGIPFFVRHAWCHSGIFAGGLVSQRITETPQGCQLSSAPVKYCP